MRILVAPMARTGAEAIGSMGTDTPIAVLSDRPRMLFDYFSQLFAQVTNPPLDGIREELVTSLGGDDRARGATCSTPGPESCRQIVLPYPVLDNEDLAKLRYIDEEGGVEGYKPVTIDALYPVLGGRRRAARSRSSGSGAQVSDAIAGGATSSSSRTATRPRSSGADPEPAHHRGGAPPPDPREDPHPGRARRSRPARRARCTTSRCCSGTARRR